MWLKVIREIVIFALCLAIFPVVVLLLVYFSGSWNMGVAFFTRELFSGGRGPGGTSLMLWAKLLTPYLAVQGVRAYVWSGRSLVGRKWANLYFAGLLSLLGAWSLWQCWDLFYFMYALDDIPAELLQFFQLEGVNLVIGAASVFLAIQRFRTFLDPTRPPVHQQRTTP
jgi:hypothetical protein